MLWTVIFVVVEVLENPEIEQRLYITILDSPKPWKGVMLQPR